MGVTDVDAYLAQLESTEDSDRNIHFISASAYINKGAKLYSFPDDLEVLATDLGLELSTEMLGPVNPNKAPIPTLTAEQQARVESIYADDIVIYNSITEAGQAHTTLPTAGEIDQAQRQAAYDIAATAFSAMPLGKQAMWEPARAAEATAILAGDMARAVEILQTTPATYPDAESDRNAFLALFAQ